MKMFLKQSLLAATLLLVGAGSAFAFELTSPNLKDGATVGNEFVFNSFGCTGGNISPALNWSNAPKDTKSFAVFAHDPDAPTGGAGFWHWAVINIPASVTTIAKGDGEMGKPQTKSGLQQISTDFGTPGWGGPCPPKGDKPHRYVFTVYALKADKIDLPPTATASFAGFMTNVNTLDKASLTATYGH